MNGSRHLDTQRVYDLLDGRLDPLAESAAQAHLLRCESCRRLERECAHVVESLHWYGTEPIEPPAGYWDTFWDRWSPSTHETEVLPLRPPRLGRSRLAPALAMAAVLALLVGLWWSGRSGSVAPEEFASAPVAQAPPLREAMASADWADDYARFEQMSIAVGGIDPVSKGIVLASMARKP